MRTPILKKPSLLKPILLPQLPNNLLSNGLLLEWRFNEGIGQVVNDYSGNGYQGQLGPTPGIDTGDPEWTREGLVLTTDDVVKHDSDGVFTSNTVKTIIMVIKDYVSAGFLLSFGNSTYPTFSNGLTWLNIRNLSIGGFNVVYPTSVGSINTGAGVRLDFNNWVCLGITLTGRPAITGDISGISLYTNDERKYLTGLTSSGSSQPYEAGGFGIGYFYPRNNSIVSKLAIAYLAIYNRVLTEYEYLLNYAILQKKLSERGIFLP